VEGAQPSLASAPRKDPDKQTTKAIDAQAPEPKKPSPLPSTSIAKSPEQNQKSNLPLTEIKTTTNRQANPSKEEPQEQSAYPWLEWIRSQPSEPRNLSLPLPSDSSVAANTSTAGAPSSTNDSDTESAPNPTNAEAETATGWKWATAWIRGAGEPEVSGSAPTDNGSADLAPELSQSFRPPIVLVTNRRGLIRWEMAPHSEAYPRYAYETNQYAFTGDRAAASQELESGLREVERNQLSAAFLSFGKAVEKDPSYFEALFNLGITAKKLNRPWVAMRALESALWVRPDHIETRLQFAALLYQNNYLIDAAQEWETVLRENPDHAQAHFLMGRLLDQEFRRPDLAKPHYSSVLRSQPSHPQAENIRSWLAWFP
jgi:hypothetical protein